MDELEFALHKIGSTRFEELAMAYLRVQGYDVHESGPIGADAGWDARVSLGDLEGIAHASTRNDWLQKIREDAKSVRELEEETGEDYDLLAFVTNQVVTGRQEIDVEQKIQEDYGWTLKIHHRSNLLGEIRTNHPELAGEYLDFDLETGDDHLEELLEQRDERVRLIQEREDYASDLELGPVIALHVIPTGVLSKRGQGYKGKIPDPPLLWKLTALHSETRGKVSFASDSGGMSELTQPGKSYGILRNDGLYESVYHLDFYQREDEVGIPLSVSYQSPGFDAYVVITVRRALETLEEMDFSRSALVSLAILDAPGLYGDRSNRISLSPQTQKLGTGEYVTEPVFVTIPGDDIYEEIEPLLNKIWRQLGIPDGTNNIDDGEWVGNSVEYNNEYLVGGE